MHRNKIAAVSLIIAADRKLLTVHNRRYNGLLMPGGRVERGESPEQAQARELLEETSLHTLDRELVYVAPIAPAGFSDRASIVYVYRVFPRGEPRENEPGCPVAWATQEEFLRGCPFWDFYARMFSAEVDVSPTMLEV